MRRLLMELVGTFFLVLAIGLTGNPVAIGLTLAVMIYVGGHVSGAHYNPAVTIAVWLRGKHDAKDIVPYCVAQLLGACLGWLVHQQFSDAPFAPAPAAGLPFWHPLLAEILFTFALVSVILNVATSKALEGNHVYGFAIGGTVTAGALAVGPISGGAFNPAVGLGPNLMSALFSQGGGNWLLYLVGPVAGGLLAAVVFKYLQPDEA